MRVITNANQQSWRKSVLRQEPHPRASASRKPSSAAFNEVSSSPTAFRTFLPDTFTHFTLSYIYTRKHIFTSVRTPSNLAYSFPPSPLPFPTLNLRSRLDMSDSPSLCLPRCSLYHHDKQKPRNRKPLENSGYLLRINAMFRDFLTR